MRQHRFSKTAFSAATVPVLLLGGLALTCSALSAARPGGQAEGCAPEVTVAAARCLLLEAAHEIRQEASYRGPNPLRSTAFARATFQPRRGSLHMHTRTHLAS